MTKSNPPGSGLLAGRYRLVERLGAGGMSVVWRGFDEVLGREVAVKVLPPSTSTDPSFRRRLRAEAKAAARLSHPHIANVHDYGEATTVDGEQVPYVVMELVDGESLAAELARSGRLPWPAAVQISCELAAALAAAHARGIVHRDVTPANVMLTPAGVKVVDFGISALIGENDIDPDGSLLGTPAYLAPERLEGGQVSPATDVYAVGLLIYRMLTGELPWEAGTTTALLRAHRYVEPEPLPPVEGLPPAVETLIARCLEKRPDDRPSGAEVAYVLASVNPTGAGFVPGRSRPNRSRPVLLVAGAVAVLGIGAYGFSMSAAGHGPTDATGNPLPSVVSPTGRCVISYTVWSDDGAQFKASVSAANRDTTPIGAWKLWFVMPGDQVLTGNHSTKLNQSNSAVTVTATKPLQPQATQTMQVTGRYKESNAAPMVFQLDGKTCETYVSGKPGAPSQPVQHLSDGTTRIGPAPTMSSPVPGLSIGTNGVVVPVPVPTLTSAPIVTLPPTGLKGRPPTDLPTVAQTDNLKAPDPPPTSNATDFPGRTTPPTTEPTSEPQPPTKPPSHTPEE